LSFAPSSAVGAELGPLLPLKSCVVDDVLLEEDDDGDAAPLARFFRLLLLPFRLLVLWLPGGQA